MDRHMHSPMAVLTYRCLGYVLGYGIIALLVTFMLSRAGWASLFSGLQPQVLILPVYFWAIYRPQFFPMWLVTVIGLVMDLVLATPLGLTSLIALALHILISSQAKLLRELPAIAVMFVSAVPIMLAELLRWLAVSALEMTMFPIFPGLMAGLAGFVIYLPLSIVFHKTNRLISIS